MIFNYLYKYRSRFERISITTNGTVVPSEYILDWIKKLEIEITISDYKCVDSTQLYEDCEKKGIMVNMYHFYGKNDMWAVLGKEVDKEEDDSVVRKRFKNCVFHRCLTLENGKLVYCSRAVNAAQVQRFALRINDYVDIRNASRVFWKIFRYTQRNNQFMEACRYCNGSESGKRVLPAIQIEKEEVGL